MQWSIGGCEVLRFGKLPFVAAAAVMFSMGPNLVWAQDRQLDLGEYEYEPGEGLHEEEWYDPSDWFDDDTQVEWEPDWNWDYDRYGYDWRDYDDYSWFDDDWDYGWHYNEFTNDWEYGWHYDHDYAVVDLTPNRDYGWYYDKSAKEWRHGWHYVNGSSQRDRQGRQAQGNRIRGEVKNIYTDEVQGRRCRVAEVETNDGRTMRVVLGPANRTRSLDLEDGDRITVFGQQRNMQGRSMFVADRVQANGRTVNLASQRSGQQQKASQSSGKQKKKRAEGEITAVYLKEIGGKKHVWTKIRTDSGRTLMADLGPRSNFRDIDLEGGDEIEVIGERGHMKGRSVLVADRVKPDDGDMVYVNRSRGGANKEMRNVRDQSGSERLHGEVRELFTKEHDGHQHTFARIDTQDGETIQADLGMQRQIDNFGLSRGDTITLFGSFGRHQGERIFRADQLRSQGTTLEVGHPQTSLQRTRDTRADSQPSSQSRMQNSIRGELLSSRAESVSGFAQPQIVAEIRLDDGRVQQVVLGSQDALDRANLTQGNKIIALTADYADAPYAVASSVYVDGEKFNTHKPKY